MSKEPVGDTAPERKAREDKGAENPKNNPKEPQENTPGKKDVSADKAPVDSVPADASVGETKRAASGQQKVSRLQYPVGMEMPNNRFRVFLGPGSIPPVTEKKHFVARLKKLDVLDVRILEGESEEADRNRFVGEIGLTNIKLREDGRAEIEIEFTLDDKGMLAVSLADRISNTESIARFVLPQFMQESDTENNVSGLPVEEISAKIDLLEQQMLLLKGELADRRERE